LRESPEPSLRRELLAILFVYALLSIVPLLVGFSCTGG
jgi:hypothetical protein